MTKPHLPEAAIRAQLETRLGEISEFQRLTEGLVSQAFGFRHDGEAYVLRIGRSLAGFAKDAFAQRTFGRPDLPIPEVLEVRRLNDQHAFCLSRRAPGKRLHDVSQADLPRLLAPTARVLEAIASSNLHGTTGFGRFDADGIAPYPTWRAFLLGLCDPDRFDWGAAHHALEPGMLERALRALERLVASCPEERCLVHGDFGSFNLLTDGERITAVIDWDLALLGDPLYEIATLLFWREEALGLLREHLLTRLAREEPPGWRERLLVYQLHCGLQEIYFSAVLGGAMEVSWLVGRCVAVLQEIEVGSHLRT